MRTFANRAHQGTPVVRGSTPLTQASRPARSRVLLKPTRVVQSSALSVLGTLSTSIPAEVPRRVAPQPTPVAPQATSVVPQTTAAAGMPPLISADIGTDTSPDPATAAPGTTATAARPDASITTGGSPTLGLAAVARFPHPLGAGRLHRRLLTA